MANIRQISHFLNDNQSGLQNTLQHASIMQNLSQRLRKHLQAPAADHIQFTNIRDNLAVISVDDAIWLTHLRYQAPEILDLIKKKLDLPFISQIHFKIVPIERPPQSAVPKRLTMSRKTSELLLSTSKGISDPTLKSALEQLAKRSTS